MKFDNVIIGGGLTGLVCGIKLQKAGKKCAIVSAGQSAMHFFSGSFELLGKLSDGTLVEKPIEAIDSLESTHPYAILGKEKVAELASEAVELLTESDISIRGNCLKNTWRITPTGERKPSWLTLRDFEALEEKDTKIGNKVLIVNILGFLDFNTKFIADSFEKQGTECRIISIKLEEMERLRKNPSEMRASNIARVMDREEVRSKVVEKIKEHINGEDVVILPAVFGLKDADATEKIRTALGIKTVFIATMPPSVPGIRTQMKLKNEFERLGGRFFMGDTVTDAEFDSDGKVVSVGTSNFGDIRLYADNFVLASGSFFSKGLVATPDRIFEPIFNIDLTYDQDREKWFSRDFFGKQGYISFGARTNSSMNASIDGKTVANLYAAGSLLGGYNPLFEGCGGGVSIITALAAADAILEK